MRSAELLRGQIGVAESGIRVAGVSVPAKRAADPRRPGPAQLVLQSIQALDLSRREYLRAVGDFDQWQFRLYRALGCPIPVRPALRSDRSRHTPCAVTISISASADGTRSVPATLTRPAERLRRSVTARPA